MQLTFEATNFHDLRLKVYRFLEESGLDPALAKGLEDAQGKFNFEGKQAEVAPPLAPKAEKKPGRPRKADETAVAKSEVTSQDNPTAVLNPAPVSPSFAKMPMPENEALAKAVAMTEPATKYTKEDCNSELQKVNSVHGLGECKKILLEFGCARLSELRESQFDAFIALCKKMSEKQV